MDYLIWELVLAANGEPTENHAFPICKGRGSFKESRRKGRLNGLSEDVIAEVEALQPYYDGQALASHPFWVLDKLCNINKHRRILLTRFKAGYGGRVAGSDKYTQVTSTLSEMKMNMAVELVAFAAFEERGLVEGSEVVSITGQMIDSVERVLPNFDRFFA